MALDPRPFGGIELAGRVPGQQFLGLVVRALR